MGSYFKIYLGSYNLKLVEQYLTKVETNSYKINFPSWIIHTFSWSVLEMQRTINPEIPPLCRLFLATPNPLNFLSLPSHLSHRSFLSLPEPPSSRCCKPLGLLFPSLSLLCFVSAAVFVHRWLSSHVDAALKAGLYLLSPSPLTVCCGASMVVVPPFCRCQAAALFSLPSLCCHRLW